MNLKSYLKNKDINPSDIILYTVGTDGVRNHSNLLSVSVKRYGEDTAEHIYVKGAEPEKVSAYIGVETDYYNTHSVCDDRLREMLMQYDAKVKVTYNHKFMERYLNPQLIDHPFRSVPCIDISLYSILKQGNIELPDELKLSEVNSRCLSIAVGVSKGSYSFKKLTTDLDIHNKPDNIIQNEYCIEQLSEVFNYMML